MRRKTTKKLLAILMIITILTADFFVLGSNIVTYAAQNSTGNSNSNIEFSSYFKNEQGERVSSIEKGIKSDNLKLYSEIKVKNEGYFNGTIEIQNSNFKIKNDILSSAIESIDKNKINLKQINYGETVEIELSIEPIIDNKISVDMMSKVSTVKLAGTYVYSNAENGENIQEEKTVCMKFKPEETVKSEFETEIITNKIFSVNGVNKRIIQILIKSRLEDNQYPIEETIIKANLTQLSKKKAEEIHILPIGELATNGKTKINAEDWVRGNEIITITLKNEPDENNKINWIKNAYDELIITAIYAEDYDVQKYEIEARNEIKVFGDKKEYITECECKIENEERNNIIIGRTEIETEEMYKGQLYANVDIPYSTTSKLILTTAGIAEEIAMKDGQDTFVTEESELKANTKYITTEINKEKILEILGQEGNIEIKSGETKTLINKDTEADENGNIIINHENSTTELEITTSNPVKAGTLEFRHTKAVTQNNYTRKELQQVIELKTKNNTLGTITVNKEKQNIIKTSNEAKVQLKETISKAELTIENNKQTLSTTEPNEVTLGITLVTNDVKYDLYKNPTITIQLPSVVEKVELISEPTKINANEFEIVSKKYDATNKRIKLDISGEQKTYAESSTTQPYFQLNLKITLSELAITQNDAITLTYTNENATQYYNNGLIQQQVMISAPSKVITKFNLEANKNKSLTETLLQKIEKNQFGEMINFKMEVINNEDSAINNVKILGKLPTTGNTITEQNINTLEMELKNITAPNADIYYTENPNATEDIEDEKNGWTKDLANLTNAKLYLIKLKKLARGDTYSADMGVQLPQEINESGISYTEYEVIYDTEMKSEATENSRTIGLALSSIACIKPEMIAEVGNDIITNEDTVKEGEVVKYTITITNKGNDTLKDIKLQGNVPEGTTLVRPIPRIKGTTEDEIGNTSGYVYAENAYYEEVKDSETIVEITNSTITELKPNQTYSKQYEVRVNKGAAGTEISNIATAECDDSKIQSEELKNKIKEANVRVTIKRTIDESIQLVAGGETRYMIYVENLSDKTINDLEMQIISDEFIGYVIENGQNSIYDENGIGRIDIQELKPNDIMSFSIIGGIKEDVIVIDTTVIVKDSKGEIYRSNSFEEDLPFNNATIKMTSPQNNKIIKEGDIVKYNISVKNTGNIEDSIKVKAQLSEYLKIQSVSVNSYIKWQSTDPADEETYITTIANDFIDGVVLKIGEEAKIEIVAIVENIPEFEHGKVVTSQATVVSFGIMKDESQMVTHILQSSPTQEDIKNIISGMAWLDVNGNGKKDVKEEILQDINVELYDLSTNSYMFDDNVNQIVTSTDEDGKYSFTKIKNGSYLIIFGYDMNKYEHTTSFAEGVDTSINSKAIFKTINVNGKETRVVAIEVAKLQDNIFNMNIGLKEGNGDLPEETPENPENPGETPDTPENPENPEEKPAENRTISGLAWLDENRNGKKDSNENKLSGIKVKIYNVVTNNYLVDSEGNIVETTTDDDGEYIFNKIHDGQYILVYEYDKEKYEPTIYLAEGVDATVNSKVVLKNININGQEITTAVTDVLTVSRNIYNVNIGLKEKLKFDLELDKYISKIVVQTSKGTKTYNYENDTFEKIEINRKQIQGALVVLEYTIKVKNTGEIAGSAKNIVDYIPSGLTFASELNKDWYLSGNNLYTKSLENVEIKPGEEKEIKLILTKTMTNDNTGLINNRAEIYEDYNQYGERDIDSTPNNQTQKEDDLGVADIIILVATGGSTFVYIILLMINMALIGIAIKIMIKNEIIIPIKKRKG